MEPAVVSVVGADLVQTSGGLDANCLWLSHFNTSSFVEEVSGLDTPVTSCSVDNDIYKFGFGSIQFNTAPIVPAHFIISNGGLDLGAGDWTIDFWIRPEQVNGVRTILTGNKAVPNAPDTIGPLMITIEDGDVQFYLSTDGSTWDLAEGEVIGSVLAGTWYHVLLQRDGDDVTSYLDGTAGATADVTGETLYDNGDYWTVGYDPQGEAGGDNPYIGHLDELRFCDIPRVSADFSPPTTEYD